MAPAPLRNVARHVTFIAGIAALLALCTAYPFLPGAYDPVAVPLSTITQGFGVVGLALVPGGLAWLVLPRFGFSFAVLSTVISTGLVLILALVATLSIGNAAGVLTLAAWAYVLARLVPGLKCVKPSVHEGVHPAPLYLVALPVLALTSQLALAAPMARSSRDRAIANAGQFIEEIERYSASHGRYPLSLEAQHRDYHSGVVGIERYVYAPQEHSYNLSFEQPRFLLDRFGTREWVVYNPRGEHRMFSHAAWLLAPTDVNARQGWYASGQTGHARWMYFLFD